MTLPEIHYLDGKCECSKCQEMRAAWVASNTEYPSAPLMVEVYFMLVTAICAGLMLLGAICVACWVLR